MNFLRILIYFALIIVMAGCKRESFDTVVNISLVSGIKRLKVNPCKVLIWRQVVEDNLLFSKAFIDTIYTDSFGMVSKLMSLSKPRKNEYYYAELIESKWQVPKKSPTQFVIKAGVQNAVGFGVKPKWRRQISIQDSSGKFEPIFFECYNSATETFYQNQKFDSFPLFGLETIYGSAPSYSHIIVRLSLQSRTTKETKIIEKTYDSEQFYDIWIKF